MPPSVPDPYERSASECNEHVLPDKVQKVMSNGSGGIMVLCPECETDLNVEEEEVDEGEIVSCPECGTDFEVVTTSPLELKAVEEGYVEEEEEVETEDGDDA